MISRFIGERRAISAFVLAFFGLAYLVFALLGLVQPELRPLSPLFGGLAAVYLVGFFALVAGYFWARWYCLGMSFSGFATAVIGMFQMRSIEPALLFWGGTHGLAMLALVGRGPATLFDGRKDWRERYHMDENAVNRLGKAIMRAGASLPYLVSAGLAPKQGMSLGFLACALGVVGLAAIVRMRTWGLVAMGGAAALLLGVHAAHVQIHAFTPPVIAPVAGALLALALVPFAGPVLRKLAHD